MLHSSSTRIRWSGAILMLGGVLWALWYVGVYLVDLVAPRYASYETYNRLMPLVLLILLTGLTGAYVQQRRSYGSADARRNSRYEWIGLAGFVLAALGLVAMIVGNVAEFWAFTEDAYGRGTSRDHAWMVFGLGMLTFYVGTVLFGVSALGARMVSPLVALPFLTWFPVGFALSGLLQLIGVPENLAFSGLNGLCGLGWILLGYELLAGRIDGDVKGGPATVEVVGRNGGYQWRL